MLLNSISRFDIRDYDFLLLNGRTFLAKGIKKFQYWRFKDELKELGYSEKEIKFITSLNHIGAFEWTKDYELYVNEQDNPGTYQLSSFSDEFEKLGKEVYCLRWKDKYYPNEKKLSSARKWSRRKQGADELLNYSFSSYINFMYNTFYYIISKKLTGEGKDKWLSWFDDTTGTTCSQIMGYISKRWFGLSKFNKYRRVYPCEFAFRYKNKFELANIN